MNEMTYFLIVWFIFVASFYIYRMNKQDIFRKKVDNILRLIDTSLDIYADTYIVEGMKTYPKDLEEIREHLVKHGLDFYKEFCIRKDFILIYLPIKENDKIVRYTLAIINRHCEAFYSNRSLGGTSEVLQSLSEMDINYLKKCNSISRHFLLRNIFMILYFIFVLLTLFIPFLGLDEVPVYNVIYLCAINIILVYINIKDKTSLDNEIFKFIYQQR